jgi:hypothetical protein
MVRRPSNPPCVHYVPRRSSSVSLEFTCLPRREREKRGNWRHLDIVGYHLDADSVDNPLIRLFDQRPVIGAAVHNENEGFPLSHLRSAKGMPHDALRSDLSAARRSRSRCRRDFQAGETGKLCRLGRSHHCPTAIRITMTGKESLSNATGFW